MRQPRRYLALLHTAPLLLFWACARPAPVAPSPPRRATPAMLAELSAYIRAGWATLLRTHHELRLAAADPKFPGNRPIVYLPADVDAKAIRQQLSEELRSPTLDEIDLRVLPKRPPSELAALPPGLLYLPYPYVVPGGRFNELYGWDGYFIVRGLIEDGLVERAREMVDNFAYEIEHYGAILNANRSYYLTRSQPPLFTEMILAVFAHTQDRSWLRSLLPAIEREYDYFTRPPHLTDTGLSRYYDFGHGRAPEVLASERDRLGKSQYDRVLDFYRTHGVAGYPVDRFYDRAHDRLTDAFFLADRAMRESGFDPTSRFGSFGAGILDYAPVCLNALLYRMEVDAATIWRVLDSARQASEWQARAERRARRINDLLWDEPSGLYLDYNVQTHTRRLYPFLTTYYPLWVGLASPAQAARIVAHLDLFEEPGGMSASRCQSGNQWDYPFGWAPLILISVEGLQAYGYPAQAERVSVNFLSLVLKEFVRRHGIFEKYNVATRSSQVGAELAFGYPSNEVGFGWTNGAFTALYRALPESAQARVLDLDGEATPPPVMPPTLCGESRESIR